MLRSQEGEISPSVIKYKLSNNGDGRIRWGIARYPKWLTPDILEGTVGAEPVVVKFRPRRGVVGKLSPGIYEAAIRFIYTKKERRIRRNVALIVEGDLVAGQQVYKKCVACHDHDVNKVGPFMRGVYGRKAGTADGFPYSSAMRAYGQIWEERNLDGFLADPNGFIPGNKMTFAGLSDPIDRMDVIAYLKSLTP